MTSKYDADALHSDLLLPIPLDAGLVDGWREVGSSDFIEVRENNEQMVPIGTVQPPIFTTSHYGRKFPDLSSEQYLRSNVIDRLIKAQKLLPPSYRLVVFDGWRSLEVQHAIFEAFYQSVVEKLQRANILGPNEVLTPETKNRISQETQKFVSLASPYPDGVHQTMAERTMAKKIPSPHNTGGAVDVCFVVITDQLEMLRRLEKEAIHLGPNSHDKFALDDTIEQLYRKYAKLPDFGTPFDFAGVESAVAYCETNNNLGEMARNNRRLLYGVMTKVGFEAYSEEWWHYNFGNQMAQMAKFRRNGVKQTAIYGGMTPVDYQKGGRHDIRHADMSDFIPTSEMKFRGELNCDFIRAIKSAQGAV